MTAEKTGMDADRSESREGSRRLDRYSFFEINRSGRDYWLPERPLFQNDFPSVRDSPTPVVLVYPRPSRKFPRPSAFLRFLVLSLTTCAFV